MSVNLLNLIGKWFSIATVSIMSFFGIGNYSEKNIAVKNQNDNINVNIINYVEKHDTVVEYNSKLPSNVTNVITEGVDKITYNVVEEENDEPTDENKKESQEEDKKVLQEAVTEVIEKGTGAYGIYQGFMTGYSADCGAGCSGEGYLACKTADNKRFSIKYDGIYYEDTEYGKVRILSAATAFPCGTIVLVTKNGVEPYYAVVMDRGGSMNSQWSKGVVHMDLAFENNDVIKTNNLTGKNIEFSVQRWGW